MPKAIPAARKTLLTLNDHVLIMIDFQSQTAFPTRSNDIQHLRNNAALVTKSAKDFNVSTPLTTVAAKSFSGPMFDEIINGYSEPQVIDRTTMNSLSHL